MSFLLEGADLEHILEVMKPSSIVLTKEGGLLKKTEAANKLWGREVKVVDVVIRGRRERRKEGGTKKYNIMYKVNNKYFKIKSNNI